MSPEYVHCRVKGCEHPRILVNEGVQGHLRPIMKHRKKYHPRLYKESIKKGVKSRRK